MKKIVEFKKQHTVLFSFIVGVLMCGFVLLRKLADGVFDVFGHDTNLYWLVRQAALMIPVMLMVVLAGQLKALKWNTKGFFGGILAGAYILAVSLIVLWTTFSIVNEDNVELKNALEIVEFVSFTLFVGMTEEFVYRGIITDSLLAKYDETGKGLARAMIVSGLIFGLAHFTNLVGADDVFDVIQQVIQMCFAGALLAAIYFRSRCIWSTVFIHALFDFALYSACGMFAGRTIGNQGQKDAKILVNVIIVALYLLVTLFLLRRKKREVKR